MKGLEPSTFCMAMRVLRSSVVKPASGSEDMEGRKTEERRMVCGMNLWDAESGRSGHRQAVWAWKMKNPGFTGVSHSCA